MCELEREALCEQAGFVWQPGGQGDLAISKKRRPAGRDSGASRTPRSTPGSPHRTIAADTEDPPTTAVCTAKHAGGWDGAVQRRRGGGSTALELRARYEHARATSSGPVKGEAGGGKRGRERHLGSRSRGARRGGTGVSSTGNPLQPGDPARRGRAVVSQFLVQQEDPEQ